VTLRFVLASLLLVSCRAHNADSEAKNVFGQDDRQDWNDASATDAFPFQSIGKLDMGCTGSVVSTRLILTAAHCLASYNVNDTVRFSFHSREGGEPWIDTKLVARGSSAANPWNAEPNDWALLLLPTPTAHQRFRVWAFGANESHMVAKQPAWLAGYSADLPDASVATKCAVRQRTGGVLYHDCDLQGGASGGPLYIKNAQGERLIVGVQSSHAFCNGAPCPAGIAFSIDKANRAVDTLSFVQTFLQWYNQYP